MFVDDTNEFVRGQPADQASATANLVIQIKIPEHENHDICVVWE